MNETLDQVKRRIRSVYLGVACIHGVGLRRAENAVCVYTHRSGGLIDTSLKQEIEATAKPFSVIIIEEDAPMIASEAD